MAFVLHPTALLKAVLDEPGAPAFREWFRAAIEGDAPLRGPALLSYEVGEVVRRELASRSDAERAEAHRALVARVALRSPDVRRTFELARDGVSFEDAAYMAVAFETVSALVCGDPALAAAAKARGLRVILF